MCICSPRGWWAVETALSSELRAWPAGCGDCLLFLLPVSAPASRAGECGRCLVRWQVLSAGKIESSPGTRQEACRQAALTPAGFSWGCCPLFSRGAEGGRWVLGSGRPLPWFHFHFSPATAVSTKPPGPGCGGEGTSGQMPPSAQGSLSFGVDLGMGLTS